MNATIILGCRNAEKGKKVIHEIIEISKNPNISVFELDLASLKSTANFANSVKEQKVTINVLINNAGMWMGNTREISSDGYEITFAVNHLGHFLLTNLLLVEIKNGKGRVVTVSSERHEIGKIDFENLQSEKFYTHQTAYSNSKLMNILFSNELGRKLNSDGINSFSVHPGIIATGLHRNQEGDYGFIFTFFYQYVFGNIGKTVHEGAQTTICAAISRKLEGKTGVYLSDCKIVEPHPDALNETLAKELWVVSQKLVEKYLKKSE